MKLTNRLPQLALLIAAVSALAGCGGSNLNFIPRNNGNTVVDLQVTDNTGSGSETENFKGTVDGTTHLSRDGDTLTADVSMDNAADGNDHSVVLRIENLDGEISDGQNYIVSTEGPNSIVYTETGSGTEDKVWTAVGGRVRIQKIEGNQITLLLEDVEFEATSGSASTDTVVINGTITVEYIRL